MVVGSYPPIPVAGAPVTISEVRRVWDAGDEAVVVSPRLSAAHLAVPIFGPLAGRRLANAGRVTGASRLVMVVEDGFPLRGPEAVQMVSALGLARAMKGFGHVRLVRAAPAAGVSRRAWAVLAAAAGEVVAQTGGGTAPGVTPVGPPEVRLEERPRQVAGALARRVLGSRAPAVRARLKRLRRAGRD
jgi:hypothetical protein